MFSTQQQGTEPDFFSLNHGTEDRYPHGKLQDAQHCRQYKQEGNKQ
jgi:hypothetical protein